MGSKGSKSKSKKRAKLYVVPYYLNDLNTVTATAARPLHVPLVSTPILPSLVPTAWPQTSYPLPLPFRPPPSCYSPPPSCSPCPPPSPPSPVLPVSPLPVTSYCYDRRYATLFPEYECEGYSPPPPRRRCKELIVCEDIYC